MRKSFLLRLTSLLLCLLLTSCAAVPEETRLVTSDLPEEARLVAPDLPEMAPYPSSEDEYDAWRESVAAQQRDSACAEGLTPFLTAATQTILTDSGDTNRIYSPLSLYMALALLAETTGGQTRAEILALLGKEDVTALRQQASDLWNANYRSDGAMTRTLATSLWLNESVPFRQETVQTLADSYYTSVYRGKMGGAELNAALQSWLNDNTLGLLTELAQSIYLPADTAAAIASTVALSARWDVTFNERATTADAFHTPDGDVTCDFMRSSGDDYIYWGERFTAAKRAFDQGGAMWFILPDEGVTTNDLLQDSEALAFMLDPNVERNSRYVKLHLSVPKFDVSSQLELSGSLRALGVTEVFDAASADFSPLTNANLPINLSQMRHDARVIIDEEGCKAAAYTVMILPGAAPPQDREEIDFVLDRPFLFVTTGAHGLPLFVGVVNHP